jgi:hypothetical protein
MYVNPNTAIVMLLLLRERLGSPPNSQRLAPDFGPVCSIGGFSLAGRGYFFPPPQRASNTYL